MICSTCGKDVKGYCKGRQCKTCVRKPQKAWRKANRGKDNAFKRKHYKDNPDEYNRRTKATKEKRHVFYLLHQKLYDRYQRIHVTDAFIRKRIRESPSNVPHVIGDQEIKDKRQKILKYWRKKQIRQIKKEHKGMIICPLVNREIPGKTCSNMQVHYEKCQGCEYQMTKLEAGIDSKAA